MVVDNYESFIKGLLEKIKQLGIDVSDLDMDHIGYQASSNEDYDRLRTEFDKLGEKISEEIVGGRRVGIYKLNTPLRYQQYTNTAIELVAPKEGQVCPSAYPENITYEYPGFRTTKLGCSFGLIKQLEGTKPSLWVADGI